MVRMRVTSSRRILGFNAFVSEMLSVSFILIKQLEQRSLNPYYLKDDGWSYDGNFVEKFFVGRSVGCDI